MITEITSGEFIVIGSGNVTNYEENSLLSFKLDIDNEKFEIVFDFIDDNNTEEVNLKAKVHNNKVTLECTNFNNPLGTGTTKAIEVAKISNKKLFINFSVSKLIKGPRNLSYTFYLKN